MKPAVNQAVSSIRTYRVGRRTSAFETALVSLAHFSRSRFVLLAPRVLHPGVVTGKLRPRQR